MLASKGKMKAKLAFLLAMFTLVAFAIAGRSYAQSATRISAPDLSKYSNEQLSACFLDLKLCGARNIWDISEQFENRLPHLSTETLVKCFADWKICGAADGQASGWPISDEIAKRGNPRALLAWYWKEPDDSIRDGIEHVAYHFNSPEVTAFMEKVVANKVDDGEDRYWPINYLAKQCEPAALKELSTGRFRNQGSMQYQSSVAIFGKCQYRPAIPYLVDEAIVDPSLNIVDAAVDSLQELYPRSPKAFESGNAMQRYYCGRAKQEGLKVECKSNGKLQRDSKRSRRNFIH